MNTQQAVTAIDPNNEIEAILDFAESGYPEEMQVVTHAVHEAIQRLMRNEQMRKRVIDAWRERDYLAFGIVVLAAAHGEMCFAAWRRLEESFQ